MPPKIQIIGEFGGTSYGRKLLLALSWGVVTHPGSRLAIIFDAKSNSLTRPVEILQVWRDDGHNDNLTGPSHLLDIDEIASEGMTKYHMNSRIVIPLI